ncbi:tetratricopeptide repeat protein, partial [Bacteroidota bacterium]
NVDCDFIQNNFGPKLDENPDDLKLAKNIFKLSYAGKCLDIPVFLKAIKVVYKQEPTYGLARLIGNRSYLNENWADALKFYSEAVDLTDENAKKANLYLRQGDIYNKQGKKSDARNMARKALGEDTSLNEAYMLIGSLYFNSYDECKKGVNKVEDRAVFFAAYEYYRKAGDKTAMANAKAQFPTMEEIFTYNMEVGQNIQCGCWIKEVVSIQRRD